LLVSTRFFLLLDIKVARFADSWIVLLQEVLQTPHAVTVRSPCLSVVLVLEFSGRGISQIGS